MSTRTRCRSITTLSLSILGVAGLLAGNVMAAQPDAVQRERLAQIKVPFVENCGQWDERVAFAAKTSFGTVFVTHEGQLVYSLGNGESGGWTLTETLISGKPLLRSGQASATRVSYFHGKDSSRWQSGLPSYEEISLGEVWRGISVSLRARGTTVEKIFTVEPGARPEKIRLGLHGTPSLRIDADGALVARTGSGEARFTAPAAYQELDGARRPVTATYVVHGTLYGFRLGNYDHALPIIIDPLLQSTYLGGDQNDTVLGMTIHPTTGEVFVAGFTLSADFPGTAGGAQQALNGEGDAFVARLDATLTVLLQATYLGGSGGDLMWGAGIAIHPISGEIFVTGVTDSTDFPGTAGGAQPVYGGSGLFGGDGFVARLDATLTVLLQSSYLGGSDSDFANAIAVHPTTGEVLVAGETLSTNFPGTAGGAQSTRAGGYDGFVARLDPTLTELLQSTYLGGSTGDSISALAVQPWSNLVLLAGVTYSSDFPATPGGAQPSYGGGYSDCFVAQLDTTLTALYQATYLGGSGEDWPSDVTTNPASSEVLVAGSTASIDFPATVGGAQPVYGGADYDGFVARLNPTLTALLQSTYLGTDASDGISALAIHPPSGEVLVAGETLSTNFPGTAGGAQSSLAGGDDGFIVRLNPTLTTLMQATYLGGSGNDLIWGIACHPTTGEVIVSGHTESTDFPGTAGGAQPALNGAGFDAFVARLTPDLAAILSPAVMQVDSLPNPGDGNFVFEPGETAAIIPSWENLSTFALTPSGQASGFTGPPGADYTILNDSVSYGTIPPGSVGIPAGAYSMSISLPDTRPATHWDAQFTETLDVQYVLPYRHILHVGDSFPDVPRSNIFYRYIENVLHHGITAGCGSGNYCPDSSVTRAQMAVFLLKSKHGSAFVPPPCGGAFADVICPSQFADWIEELFNEGITGGCGGGNYCPDNPVTRAQMAVFLLKAQHGSAYTPPVCAGLFGDVTCPSLFADWIEQLAAEGITGGCGGGNYCPNNPNTRGQMAAFLVKTFGLVLYGP
jgi:hypothetical protein